MEKLLASERAYLEELRIADDYAYCEDRAYCEERAYLTKAERRSFDQEEADGGGTAQAFRQISVFTAFEAATARHKA